MERKGFERFAPLTGLLFLALAIASFIVGGEAPEADESLQEVIEFWEDNDSSQIASALLGVYAAFFLVWFAGSVRSAVARVEGAGSRLASLAFGGAVISAAGITVNAAVQFTAADSIGDISPEATQALSVFYSDFFFPFAVGNALFLTAAGLAAVRHGAFDRWLGWMAIVIGVISITPLGFFGFIGSLAWVGIAAVVLYRKTDPVGSGAVPPSSGGVPPSAGGPPPAGPEAPA